MRSGIEPTTSHSWGEHSATEPPLRLMIFMGFFFWHHIYSVQVICNSNRCGRTKWIFIDIFSHVQPKWHVTVTISHAAMACVSQNPGNATMTMTVMTARTKHRNQTAVRLFCIYLLYFSGPPGSWTVCCFHFQINFWGSFHFGLMEMIIMFFLTKDKKGTNILFIWGLQEKRCVL